jgi:hypothetical protein
MRLFESKKLDNSQMRSLYGGAKCTDIDKNGVAHDFRDDCGKTHYDDCGIAAADDGFSKVISNGDSALAEIR